MAIDLARLQQCLIDVHEQPVSHQQPKQAAVLVPIISEPNSPQLLLTRRARHLKQHAGQISFPGGRFESGDGWLGNTALRETQEEIGLPSEHIRIVGKLPQQDTISRYNVTPYVGFINQLPPLAIDRNEVESVFTVPLQFVLDTNNHQKVTDEVNGQSFSFYLIQYNRHNIWGATARIIVNLSRRYHQFTVC